MTVNGLKGKFATSNLLPLPTSEALQRADMSMAVALQGSNRLESLQPIKIYRPRQGGLWELGMQCQWLRRVSRTSFKCFRSFQARFSSKKEVQGGQLAKGLSHATAFVDPGFRMFCEVHMRFCCCT